MKVILNQIIPKIGKKDQVVEVKKGFARNYLFPRGMAVIATKPQVKALEHRLARLQLKSDAQKASAEQMKEKLDGKTIKIEGKVGIDGHKLFGAITSQNICDLIKQEFNVELDKKQIGLLLPIKRLGIYKIPIDLHQKVDASIDINVFDPNAPIVEAKESTEHESQDQSEQPESTESSEA